MNTSVQLDSLDIHKLNKKYNDAYIKEFLKRLESEDLSEKVIVRHVPMKDKKLVALYLNIDSWKKLQHWIVDNSNEERRASLRDALLTLMEVD